MTNFFHPMLGVTWKCKRRGMEKRLQNGCFSVPQDSSFRVIAEDFFVWSFSGRSRYSIRILAQSSHPLLWHPRKRTNASFRGNGCSKRMFARISWHMLHLLIWQIKKDKNEVRMREPLPKLKANLPLSCRWSQGLLICCYGNQIAQEVPAHPRNPLPVSY